MFTHSRRVLLSVVIGSLMVSSAQAGPRHFGGGGHGQGLRNAASRFSNKFSQQGSGSGMQVIKKQAAQTLNQPARPTLSTMDVIKASNFATDVKDRLKNHQFEPSTMDVIKASNFASDVKDKLKNHQFEPSTMDAIKATNFLKDVKSRVLNR